MTEQAALAYLFQFADWERGGGWNPRAAPDEAWKLGRTRALLDLAGLPERRSRAVTIVGTNGKGSTGAVLESILRAAGRRVGVYSQPHLHSYRERIRIDGLPVTPETFATGVARLGPMVADLARGHPEAGEPTTFELTTALAAMLFADAAVDVALYEVGLGGRLDAVNAIDSSLVLVTSIGYDHVQILGGSLASIAREKAGVFRADARALTAPQRPTVWRVLAREAQRHGAALRRVTPLALAGAIDPARGQLVRLPVLDAPAASKAGIAGRTGVGGPRELNGGATAWLRLLGQHQRDNAALALAAAGELLRSAELVSAAAAGLAAARWPGRLEWVPGRPPVVLDGAHNPPGAEALAYALDELALGRSYTLVFGCARDKDARGLLKPLLAGAQHTLTASADDRRAAEPARLAALVRALGVPAAPAGSVAEALERARTAGPPLIVVAGSLRVVAEAREALGLRKLGC